MTSTMVLGAAIKYFRIQSIQIGLKYTSQVNLTSFDKTCSKKFGLHIQVITPIQQNENIPGYNTGVSSDNNNNNGTNNNTITTATTTTTTVNNLYSCSGALL